ncbi:23S rRNA (adenine(2503)-C(2))-methyltransferase RlmN [Tessaracoccus rhinocerotis]|uniref:Probable dual-specificity RNA methyltransferase RlmN n=1 Tax=Tessaracoccus rhinocerotis TaxID=1689449 RepID=A0A553K2P1_9ACTN|nr:23S rRNA (adenine(2503)-C(2))-methyltransferase RlmN [Tessaracoccus rhinocerotis]
MPTLLPLVFEAPRRGKPPRHWLDLSPEERRDTAEKLGLPKFRADQISRHVFDHLSDDPDGWSDVPAAIRADLAEQLFPSLLEQVTRRTADKGTTVKTLWKLHDGSLLESVLMRYPNRSTLCISSQAGCGMACPFCATGQGGLKRNLSQAEITIQAFAANQMIAAGEVPGATGRLNNIVFMGMGEPLANYKPVMGAIRTLLEPSPNGFGMSARGITVSTVGLVPQIQKLTEEGLPLTLAVSLHAPDDELRDEIVPVNNRWKVDEVVDAAWAYAERTKRRVSIEYAMMRDINDQVARANLLADVLKRRGDWGWVHVNLIPLNPTPGSKWTASRKEDERAFIQTLERRGVPVTLRDTRGSEIDGACGQLAATVESESA